jgi:outer membrane protein TolC
MTVKRVRFPRLSRTLRGGIVAGISLIVPAQALQSAEPPVAPVQSTAAPANVPVLNLADCLHLGRCNQPSIRAGQASLGAAQQARSALNDLGILARFSRELPYRKDQACHGIAARSANLRQVYRDVDASVARLYYAVIYAREQKKVAESIVARLKAVVANGQTLLGKEGAPADLNPFQITKAKGYLAISEARVFEADRGLSRATSALREAMGFGPELQFQVAEDKLPAPVQGIDRDQILQLAMSCRGEVEMAQHGAAVTCLEIQAQMAVYRKKRMTAAGPGDVHANPVPTGSFGDDYKPGAIGLDYPSFFVGPRDDRVKRACEINERAGAAAEKSRILVALEADDAWLKWDESIKKIARFTESVKEEKDAADKAEQALVSGVSQSYRDVLEMMVLAAQSQAHLNEALYNHAVALTDLERATGGAFPTLTVNVP